MKILMMTNTYLPLVGGLERSIESFTNEYRKRGHRVLIGDPRDPAFGFCGRPVAGGQYCAAHAAVAYRGRA